MIGLRLLRISDELLVEMLASGTHPRGYEITEDGLPADARIVDMVRDPNTFEVKLKIASSEFDGPLEGGSIPTICPKFRNLG